MSNDAPRKPKPTVERGARPGAARRGKAWKPAKPRAERPSKAEEELLLFGLHAVRAGLENPDRVIRRLFLTENAERRLGDVVQGRPSLETVRVSPRDLDRRLGADTVHQGVLAEVDALAVPDLNELATLAGDGPLVILDQVTDPHNVGAILRSAAVFGASGLVMTRRHSPPMGGVLAKSASGALEKIPIATVQNLARAIADLRDGGVRVLGLDGAAERAIEAIGPTGPVALVLGAEGKGLREKTRDSCDDLVRISFASDFASLNVSNAAAVALHTLLMTRG